jgi:hypothetical protein
MLLYELIQRLRKSGCSHIVTERELGSLVWTRVQGNILQPNDNYGRNCERPPKSVSPPRDTILFTSFISTIPPQPVISASPPKISATIPVGNPKDRPPPANTAPLIIHLTALPPSDVKVPSTFTYYSQEL